MKSAAAHQPAGAARSWLVAIVLASLCINLVGIGWGLPNENATWAADSLQPMAPMAVAKHGLWGERWNSGWFYFKYPLGHPVVLLAAQLPYLVWLRASGQLRVPKSTYPYGFQHPERALTVLALLTRGVSVCMGVAVVVLAYRIASLLFGTAAGLIGAVLVAGNYPIVFYAHTANVDVPLLFWVALAVAATLQCAERGALSAAATAGVAAAMAVLTKEQSMGALIVVPLIWLLRRGALGALERGMVLRVALTAGIGFVVTTLLVGNVWWNPMGFINRWRFLLGILPPEVRDQYAPYQFQVQIPKGLSLTAEFQRLLKVGGTVEQALTPPVLVLCLAGAAWAVWQRPRAAAIPLAVIVSYYTLSLRATALIQVRYTMPLLFFALLLGGAAGGALMARIGRLSHRGTRRVATALVAAAVGLALLPGIEISRLLVHDPRYVAEAWLREHVWPSARVEIYERPTYLPRFNSDVQVVRVPVEERTLEGLQQRQPDFVVLSSGGRAGLTGRYVRNWEPGKPIIVDLESAKEFFDRLRSEQLGYRRVGHFQTPGRWITPRINSVNPEITIYARQQASDAVNGS